jgi:hypothetical protein
LGFEQKGPTVVGLFLHSGGLVYSANIQLGLIES